MDARRRASDSGFRKKRQISRETKPSTPRRHLDTRQQRSKANSRPSARYDRRPRVDVDAVTTAANAATSADDALVRRARTGDAAAFEVLVDSRIDRCYRLAWSILANDADAADATQDALVSAWRQLPRLRDPGDLRRLAQPDRRERRVEGAPASCPTAGGVRASGLPGRRNPAARTAAGPTSPNRDGRVRRQRRDRRGPSTGCGRRIG